MKDKFVHDIESARAEWANQIIGERDRLRAEVEILVWNLAGISTMACRRTPILYNGEMARPALDEVAELVKDYDRLRAENAELEKAMARMTGEICRADNALAESGPSYVSGASLADGIRVLTMDNAKFRELLGLALSDSKCGAEDDFFTVATECTEGKCWHIKARDALSRAEQAKPESDKLKEVKK